MESTSPKIGRETARVLFAMVLNPLIEALEQEVRLVEGGRNTWRFRPAGLEGVRLLILHLPRQVWPNLEQFEGVYRVVSARRTQHDRLVDRLKRSCSRLQGTLERSDAFEAAYRRATSPESLAALEVRLEDLFGAYPPQDHVRLLAQFTVNGHDRLSDRHATAPLWNRHSAAFLRLRQVRFVGLSRAVIESGLGLGKAASAFDQHLRVIRATLAQRHDLPYVEPLPPIAGRLGVDHGY